MKPVSRISRLALLFFCVAALPAAARADVKIKSRSNAGGQATESVTYIKGKRQRTEYGSAVSIMQCDLRRSLQLVVPTKSYTVTPFGGNDTTAAAGGAATAKTAGQPTTRGGVVTSTYTSTDTGERKQMFGYTARRIKTSIVTESSPDSCNPSKSRMESDGWYIDAAFVLDCATQAYSGYVAPATAGGCRDQYRTKQIGNAKLGYPVMVTTTMFDESGKPSFTYTQEVVEISKAVLDDALFEVPADYKEASSQQALYGAGASSPSTDDEGAAGGNVAGDGPNVNAPSAAAAAAAGPKRAGVVRVGVAVTRAVAAGNLTAESLSQALREGFAGQLAGPNVEVTALTSEFPQQIEEEARRKQCDFVLYTAATHKKGGGGGGFGGFLKKAAPVVVGGSAESGGASQGFKSKDELTLEYSLQRTGASVLAASATLKAKAKSDGEDLVGQLVGQAAPAVAVELNKK